MTTAIIVREDWTHGGPQTETVSERLSLEAAHRGARDLAKIHAGEPLVYAVYASPEASDAEEYYYASDGE